MPANERPGNDIILKSKMCSAVFAAIEVSFKIDQEKPSHVSLYTNLSTRKRKSREGGFVGNAMNGSPKFGVC